jgi:Protein of unknown function (DUF2924)
MKPAINESSARQRSGEPSPVRDRNGNRNARPRSADIAEVGRQIAELVDLSTQELRVGWGQLHRTGPPPGLSRDLLIRGLVHQLQEQTYGGVSRALQRRLRTLSAEFEKGASCSDSRIVLKTGTTLVRQWRGRAHTVLVRENGFEYEGQHYRSLTVIAEKITGAHWSGPRFFGLTRRAGASVVDAEAGR